MIREGLGKSNFLVMVEPQWRDKLRKLAVGSRAARILAALRLGMETGLNSRGQNENGLEMGGCTITRVRNRNWYAIQMVTCLATEKSWGDRGVLATSAGISRGALGTCAARLNHTVALKILRHDMYGGTS